jgi:LEA14-like dessication related protein
MKQITYLLLVAILFISACRQPKELVYQNVENFSIKQVGTQKTSISLDMRLYNPNNYKLKIKHADVDVFLAGNRLGRMNVQEKFLIPRQDTFLIPVTLDIDLKNALPNALQLLFNSEVDVKLAGTIRAGRHCVFVTIPVNYEGKQDIRSGLKW